MFVGPLRTTPGGLTVSGSGRLKLRLRTYPPLGGPDGACAAFPHLFGASDRAGRRRQRVPTWHAVGAPGPYGLGRRAKGVRRCTPNTATAPRPARRDDRETPLNVEAALHIKAVLHKNMEVCTKTSCEKFAWDEDGVRH